MPLHPRAARALGLAANPSTGPVCAGSTLLFLALLWDCTSSILSKHCPKRASNTLLVTAATQRTCWENTGQRPPHPVKIHVLLVGAPGTRSPGSLSGCVLINSTAHSRLDSILKQQLELKRAFLLHYLVRDLTFFFFFWSCKFYYWLKRTGHDFLIRKVLKLYCTCKAFLSKYRRSGLNQFWYQKIKQVSFTWLNAEKGSCLPLFILLLLFALNYVRAE